MNPEPRPLPSPSPDAAASPTMEDLARALGVHRSTVSLALRNHPKISQATRQRVRETAQRLGYRPNPLVSALMSYRANHRKPTWRGTLGIITSAKSPEGWRQPPAYRLMHAGALQRARELGYDLQPFWVHDPALPIRRFNAMLRTLNVPGVIVAPLFSETVLPEIDWSMFSAIAIGHTLQTPDLHRVTHDYFHSMATAIRGCLDRGKRRIGLALDAISDARVDHLWSSAYFTQLRLNPEMEPLEPFIPEQPLTPELFAAWLRRTRPEVVISLPGHFAGRALSKRSAQNDLSHGEIEWVSLGCYERESADSGIFQNYEAIGAAAVDLLTALINRGERGIPKQSHVLQIKGIWVEGTGGG
ncbi:MAG TPA: LacI family DNA-binding transcriptional regulator [Chthoniobacteraceae bacterium]|nr:LacI family DNA-binding transcriptional regulator [Chthoniobacteraceae bacterium]